MITLLLETADLGTSAFDVCGEGGYSFLALFDQLMDVVRVRERWN